MVGRASGAFNANMTPIWRPSDTDLTPSPSELSTISWVLEKESKTTPNNPFKGEHHATSDQHGRHPVPRGQPGEAEAGLQGQGPAGDHAGRRAGLDGAPGRDRARP